MWKIRISAGNPTVQDRDYRLNSIFAKTQICPKFLGSMIKDIPCLIQISQAWSGVRLGEEIVDFLFRKFNTFDLIPSKPFKVVRWKFFACTNSELLKWWLSLTGGSISYTQLWVVPLVCWVLDNFEQKHYNSLCQIFSWVWSWNININAAVKLSIRSLCWLQNNWLYISSKTKVHKVKAKSFFFWSIFSCKLLQKNKRT